MDEKEIPKGAKMIKMADVENYIGHYLVSYIAKGDDAYKCVVRIDGFDKEKQRVIVTAESGEFAGKKLSAKFDADQPVGVWKPEDKMLCAMAD